MAVPRSVRCVWLVTHVDVANRRPPPSRTVTPNGGKLTLGGGGGGGPPRGPQSTQSVPREHEEYSAPGPPSSQSPSLLYRHVLLHGVLTEAAGVLVEW